MIPPDVSSLAVSGNQSDPLLLELVKTVGQLTLPLFAFQLFNRQIEVTKESTEKQNAATEKQIAANKESTEKQIADNKELTEKQIAATEKQIAANKELTEKQIAATEKQIAATEKQIEADIKVTREITREVIKAADARFENILLQIKQINNK